MLRRTLRILKEACQLTQDSIINSSSQITESELNAIKLKDKLLSFDREFVKRTHVYDAQGDYYASPWLSEEEQKSVIEKENKRRAKLASAGRDKGFEVKIDILGRVQLTDVLIKGDESSDDDDNSDNDNIINTTNSTNSTNNKVVPGNNLQIRNTKSGSIYRSLREKMNERELQAINDVAKLTQAKHQVQSILNLLDDDDD